MNKSALFVLALIIAGALAIGGVFTKLPKSNTPSKGNCTVGEAPTVDKRLTLPAILSPNDKFDGDEGDYGVDVNKTASYKLIRTNVPMLNEETRGEKTKTDPIFDLRTHTEKYTKANIPGFIVYYPGKFGEVTMDQPFLSKYEGSTTEFRFRQEGIIFLVHVDASNNPVIFPGRDRKGAERRFWLADLYQEVSKAGDTTRGYKLDEIFSCTDAAAAAQTITTANLAPTNKNGLQIGTFTLKSSSNGFDAHCKPAIYLYPEKPNRIKVKVHTKGELTYADPLYPKEGWDVFAYPDGRIISSNKDYKYLYYESRVPDTLVNKPKTGYVYTYDSLGENFSRLLPKLGLSQEQTQDFSSYWLKVLPKAPYYFIGIFSEQNLNSFEPLEITPKEDTLIRVRIYFQALEQKMSVPEPVIVTPSRQGFTVVEWGGMIKLRSGEEFTCLQ